MIVVDTNVLSELMRPSPSPQVREWVEGQRASELFVAAIWVAEILYGIERLTDGKRKNRFADLARELFTEFGDQALAFDQRAASIYAIIASRRDALGAPINGFDAQIAAICATAATERVFEGAGSAVKRIPVAGFAHAASHQTGALRALTSGTTKHMLGRIVARDAGNTTATSST